MASFLLFFLLIAGVMIMMATFAYQKWVQAMEAWTTAASTLGLQKAASSLLSQASMSGNIRGIDVRVYSERRGSGDDKKTYTVYSAFYLSDAPAVTMKREAGFGFMKRLLRTTDVQVGDPAFDSALVVDSSDPAAITEFLTPARRHAVLSLVQNWPTAEVSNTRLLVAKRGLELDANVIVSTVNRLVDTALVMGEPVAVDRVLQLEADGELAAGAAQLAQINSAGDNVFTKMLEASAVTMLGDSGRAERILEEVEEQLPADPEVMELRDMIARPTPPLEATAVPTLGPVSEHPPEAEPVVGAASPEPPGVGGAPVDADLLIDDLFGSNRLGHEVDTRFLEAYHGRPVRWTGTVEQIRPYRGDRDFGSEEGQKAKVLIGNIGDGRLVTSRVEAVVQLPTDAPVERGDEITFTGTLLRIDRFMRNIYVAGGRLAA